MPRIDPTALATHLEVAIALAPAKAVTDLAHVDAQRRRSAARALSECLADRLGCFEFSAPDLGDRTSPLFGDALPPAER